MIRRGAAAPFALCSALASLAAACLAGCTSAAGAQRLETSSLGCMRAVVAQKVPHGIPDKAAHCLAAGSIARYCSRPEAYLASVGKELEDLVDLSGDFEWADLKADRLGVGCAAHVSSDAALAECCRAALIRAHLPSAPEARQP